MSKQTSLVELRDIITQKTKLPQNVVEAFLDQLFVEMRNSIVDQSFLKLEGLGIFRVIQSGGSYRILFLGSKQPVSNSLNVSKFKESLDEFFPKEIEIDNTKILETQNLSDEYLHHSLTHNSSDNNEDNVLKSNTNINTIEDTLSHAPQNERKSNLIKTSVIVFIILVIISILTFFIRTGQGNNEEFSYTTNFIELENSDTTNFSYIVIPESDVSLQYISNAYYGNVDFWPYIYNANEDLVNNHLIIQADAIVKIPKIVVDLTEYQNGTAILHAKNLGDQIRQAKNIN